MKKGRHFLALGLITLFTGCTTTVKPDAPFPAEFIGADYLLSDEHAKQWAIASRQAEQCIYPNLTRIQQQHFAKEDAYIHAQYVLFYPLEKLIGERYLNMVQEDEKSMGYAQQQFKKYHDVDIEPLAAQPCQRLREQARADLAVLKGQYQSGMVEPRPATPPKNSDGVATNENKFFFDIIKWGAALLL